MNLRLLAFFLAVTTALLTPCPAQSQPQSQPQNLDELIAELQSQPDDAALNSLLRERAVVDVYDPEADGIEILGDAYDSLPFHVEDFTAELEYANLFGDSNDEAILLLSGSAAYALCVYRKEDSLWVRVDGGAGLFATADPNYFDQTWDYQLAEVAEPGLNCLLIEKYYGYNRSTTGTVEIIQVQADGFNIVHSFFSESSSYSGLLTYSYSTSRSYAFDEENGFPRTLIIEETTTNEDNDRMDQSGNPLSGKVVTINGTITVTFAYQNGLLSVDDEIRNLEENVVEFSTSKDGVYSEK